MTSDCPFQFPPCYNHGRRCSLPDHPPEEAYFLSLTSDEKTEEPPGGKRKLLLRFQLKNTSPDDNGALVPGEIVANGKFASLEVVEVQATRQQNPPESTQLGFVPEIPKVTAEANKNQKKRRFSFALSRDEIEADILAVSGMKPKKRPKKRAKNVKKRELDYLFPGFGMNLDY